MRKRENHLGEKGSLCIPNNHLCGSGVKKEWRCGTSFYIAMPCCGSGCEASLFVDEFDEEKGVTFPTCPRCIFLEDGHWDW